METLSENPLAVAVGLAIFVALMLVVYIVRRDKRRFDAKMHLVGTVCMLPGLALILYFEPLIILVAAIVVGFAFGFTTLLFNID